MDFGTLPPEVNSARMHSGSGAGSMLAAADAWDRLAEAVYGVATSYRTVTAGLVAKRRAPAAITMGQTAAYIGWLKGTAALAQRAAAQARAAADAYESALAATVPPEAIVTNRTWRTSLAATNRLGQGAHAIAAAEADYDKMWAQDADAMYTYARASAAASEMTPFTAPPAAGAAAEDPDRELISVGSQLISMLPEAVQTLSSASSERFNAALLSMSSSLAELSSLKLGFARGASVPLAMAVTGAAKAVWGKRAAITAGFGGTMSIGGMSVPRAWSAAPNASSVASQVPSAAAAISRRAGGRGLRGGS